MRWMMFSHKGVGMLDVTFYQREEDGTLVRLDHKKILGYPEGAEPEHMRGLMDVYKVGDSLCDSLGGADIRIVARKATTQGWKDVSTLSREDNVCPLLTYI